MIVNIEKGELIRLLREDEDVKAVILEMLTENVEVSVNCEKEFQYCEDSESTSINVGIRFGREEEIKESDSF